MVVLMINCMACVTVDDPTYATALGLPLNNYLQRAVLESEQVWQWSSTSGTINIGNGRHATVRYCIA